MTIKYRSKVGEATIIIYKDILGGGCCIAEVTEFEIYARFRGRGYGRILYQQIEEDLLRRKCLLIFGWERPLDGANPLVVSHFWDEMGFIKLPYVLDLGETGCKMDRFKLLFHHFLL